MRVTGKEVEEIGTTRLWKPLNGFHLDSNGII